MERRIIVFLFIAILSLAVSAETTPPETLERWKGWILEKHPDIDCPRLDSQARERRCAWPGTLHIEVTAKGARFSQGWEVYGESWLPLPGNQQHWPSDVTLNNAAAAVLDQNNKPVLRVAAGTLTLAGVLNWNERPQYLQLPADTALVSVSIDGKAVPRPNIDNNGRLWFKRPQAQNAAAKKGDSVRVEVFRRLSDGVPITMRSILRLVVSGKPRELVLGKFLLDDSEETFFTAASLPARIEDDGSLRIQVRAGTWLVSMESRFTGKISTLGMQASSEDWPDQEIWSFASDPNIRGVKISGVQALDPSQLDMPENWQNIPTYLVDRDSQFIIEEQYRGDVAPSANQIKTQRQVWLDFNGRGATVKDTLSGTMNQGWRLSTQPLLQLGRVSVNGQPQLVTKLAGDDSGGIEIRQSQLNVEAISRLQERDNLSASGWQTDVDSLNMILNLPPGWQLWHASGADSISHSWLSKWDLWDLFLCLLIVGATFKLLGLPWALLATLTLALTYHESNAPVATWVSLIIVLPLLKVLPAGALRRFITQLGYFVTLSLIIISLLFAVQQVRRALYPQLEQARMINTLNYDYAKRSAGAAQGQMEDVVVTAQRRAQSDEMDELEMRDNNITAGDRVLSKEIMSAVSPAEIKRPAAKIPQQRYQPSANTQTGPNQPTWQWHTVRLNWSGPVTAEAPLALYLSPPWLSRILWFAQVGMIGLLVFGFARLLLKLTKHRDADKPGDDTAKPGTAAVASLMLLAVVLANTPGSVAAQDAFPPDYLLKEWEQRLLEDPKCAPHCLAYNAAQVTVSGDVLQIRLRVGTGTPLGIPLPFDPSWQVSGVRVNGDPSGQLAKSGNRLWLQLGRGNFDVSITGRVSGDSVNIPFALNPHNVTVSAEDWEIFGLQDRRVPSKSLQLQKRVKQVTEDALLPDPIAPFVRVNRHLDMDIDWHITTRVERIAPRQGGLSVKVPLLQGERVLDENFKVSEENGVRYVTATFAARQGVVAWRSVIQPIETLTFTASDDPLFVETFSAQSSPRWHMGWEGLTPVKTHRQQGATPRWLPWPGEQVTLKLVKPEPVDGPTTTVESVRLNSKPGQRSTDLELSLTIRTSLGGDFHIQQPANARLESISLDGREIPKQEDEGTVILPLRPGVQDAGIQWSIAEGVGLRTSTPQIALSEPAGNIDLSLTLPQSRWPLLVSGPDIGPAMLYWGVLIVILAVAVALGRIIRQQQLSIPVNTWQWVLLGLGMSTVNMVGSVPVVLWFFAMEARKRYALPEEAWKFNLMQMAIVVLSLIAIISLFATIPESLLSTPDMQVTGNGSYNYLYNWYQDNSEALLPQGTVISVPIWVYRIAMLAWSLWLVFAILKWAKWSWQCFSREKLWASNPPKDVVPGSTAEK